MENLSSINPTLVNNKIVEIPTRLKHKDVFTVGARKFRFEYGNEEASQPIKTATPKAARSTPVRKAAPSTPQQKGRVTPLAPKSNTPNKSVSNASSSEGTLTPNKDGSAFRDRITWIVNKQTKTKRLSIESIPSPKSKSVSLPKPRMSTPLRNEIVSRANGRSRSKLNDTTAVHPPSAASPVVSPAGDEEDEEVTVEESESTSMEVVEEEEPVSMEVDSISQEASPRKSSLKTPSRSNRAKSLLNNLRGEATPSSPSRRVTFNQEKLSTPLRNDIQQEGEKFQQRHGSRKRMNTPARSAIQEHPLANKPAHKTLDTPVKEDIKSHRLANKPAPKTLDTPVKKDIKSHRLANKPAPKTLDTPVKEDIKSHRLANKPAPKTLDTPVKEDIKSHRLANKPAPKTLDTPVKEDIKSHRLANKPAPKTLDTPVKEDIKSHRLANKPAPKTLDTPVKEDIKSHRLANKPAPKTLDTPVKEDIKSHRLANKPAPKTLDTPVKEDIKSHRLANKPAPKTLDTPVKKSIKSHRLANKPTPSTLDTPLKQDIKSHRLANKPAPNTLDEDLQAQIASNTITQARQNRRNKRMDTPTRKAIQNHLLASGKSEEQHTHTIDSPLRKDIISAAASRKGQRYTRPRLDTPTRASIEQHELTIPDEGRQAVTPCEEEMNVMEIDDGALSTPPSPSALPCTPVGDRIVRRTPVQTAPRPRFDALGNGPQQIVFLTPMRIGASKVLSAVAFCVFDSTRFFVGGTSQRNTVCGTEGAHEAAVVCVACSARVQGGWG